MNVPARIIPFPRPMSKERIAEECQAQSAHELLWDQLISSACPDLTADLERLVEEECFACTLGLDGQIGARP